MDRSRILILFLLILTVFSIIIGVTNLAMNQSTLTLSHQEENFLAPGRAGVAMFRIRGVITDGAGDHSNVGVDRLLKQLREVRKSDAIQGVILEINSPGGTIGATKKIYDEVIKIRNTGKPVVAIVTDIAASGGYYVASAANRILCYNGSIIGSIGVIYYHIDISELLKKYGIAVTTIKNGEFKDSSYPFRSMTTEEIRMHQVAQNAAYEQFVLDVAEGRKERIGDVKKKWADGRIFSGEEARRENLVDDFGDQDAAMEYIKNTLKLSKDLPILEPRPDFWEGIMGSLPFGARMGMTSSERLFNSQFLYLYPGTQEFKNSLLRLFSERKILEMIQ